MDVLGILPAPVRAQADPGAPFLLTPAVRVVVGEEPEAVGVAVLVAARIGGLGDVPVAVVHADDGAAGSIVLRLAAAPDAGPQGVLEALPALGVDTTLSYELAREAYRLTVTTERVEILATTAAGLVRGVASLVQMVQIEPDVPEGEPDGSRWPQVACATVVDHPRLAWRGLQLDVCEHPLAFADAQAVVALLCALRMNVLHLRLADGVSGVPDVLAEGGDVVAGYTELQAYAAARQIAVVPEVDVSGGTLEGHPATEILGRVTATTRAPVVHVGGRVPDGGDVETARRCGDRVGRAADDVAAAGAVVMAWQCAATALSGARHPGHLLQVRDLGDPALAAAVADGAALVLSPPELDLGPGAAPLGRRLDVDPVAAVRAAGLPPSAVRGVEAVVDGAHGGTSGGLFAALLPDLAAVAEVAWCGSTASGRDSFAQRLAAERGRWGLVGLPAPATGA